VLTVLRAWLRSQEDMKSSFYIASGLGNAPVAKALADDLKQLGHTITYEWWLHGSVLKHGPERIAEVAAAEVSGVLSADIVVVLLPGGRGTHVELGAAIGSVIWQGFPSKIFVVGDVGQTTECAFYYHPKVNRVKDVGEMMNQLAIWSAA